MSGSGGLPPKTSKPQWQLDAEREARTAQGHRGLKGSREGPNDGSGVQNVFLDSIKNEIKTESVSNTARLQATLTRQIQELGFSFSSTDDEKKEYDALRLRCVETRNELIIQREAAGFTQNNASMIEAQFKIPNRKQ